MNFKRIEIFGFKSFADKTVVDFNDGITGIVGPNGSGKSNFSDAIKWVLGEQSPKALRGKNMQDVIFNGTQKRGSLSYCEVVLVFDNTNKIFPKLEFDEVAISRKLYRNNESEYSINGTVCRLKDIKDTIRDTGLGKDGYSIIGQGKVAEIIDAKPEARRTIFEEAAGISKYKVRKVEAENKLERTREHIERLQDIIREIERRIGPLSKQAEDAKTFLTLYDELRILEVNLYLYTFDNSKILKLNIDTTLKGIEEEIQKVLEDIKQCDEKYTNLSMQVYEVDQLISELKDTRTEIMVDEQKRIGEGQLLNERLKNFNEELDKIKTNIEKYNSQINEKTDTLAQMQLKKDNAQLELEKTKREYARIDEKYTNTVDEIVAKEKEIESSNQALIDAMDRLSEVKTDLTKLKADLDNLNAKKAELEIIIKTKQESIDKEELIRQEITENLNVLQKARNDANNERIRIKKLINELKMEQVSINSDMRDLSSKMSSAEATAKILNDVKNRYEGFQFAVRRLMQETKIDYQLKNKILGVVAEIIKVPKELELAIEVALGASMNNVVTATDEDVKYIINVLKSKKFGVVTFLPLNKMRPRELNREFNGVLNDNGCIGIASKIISYNPKFENVIGNLLGTTIICDTYDNALLLSRKYRSGFKIVTLEGEVLSTQGSITGGSRKTESSNILGQERELEEAIATYKQSKSEIGEKANRLREVEKELDDLNAKLTSTDIILNAKEVEYATAGEKESKSYQKIDDLLDELAQTKSNYDLTCQAIEKYSNELQNIGEIEGNISGKKLEMGDNTSKIKLEFDNRKKYREELLKDLTDLRLKNVDLESKIESYIQEIERLEVDLKDLRMLLSDDLDTKNILNDSIANTQSLFKNVKLNDADQAKIKAIDSDIFNAEQKKNQVNADILYINQQKDSKNKEYSYAVERKVKEEAKLEKIDSQMSNLTQRLSEEYQLDHEGAQRFKDIEFEDKDVNIKIANLKRAITKLGNINTGAIEEFQFENERYTKLTTERDDLVKAESDLMNIIKELSNEMKEIFDIEFAKISKNFEQTFKDIFGGGKGELVLDKDCEDPLSAGIDILAQPPGKKLGQITLFSGGEMALTAIAILFAILKSRPMPFCVLDEIEAALDESNARLFAKYLKRFVMDTQFIVITHRKPTMEQADRLFGVTMQEKGVSKIVSVALSEAVKTIQTEQAN